MPGSGPRLYLRVNDVGSECEDRLESHKMSGGRCEMVRLTPRPVPHLAQTAGIEVLSSKEIAQDSVPPVSCC